MAENLLQLAASVLRADAPDAKVRAAGRAADAWRRGVAEIGEAVPVPARPARPEGLELRRPGDMPRRRRGGEKARAALLHAIAHIEFNAIDLAFDLIARFARADLPPAFVDDWIAVGADEARHFSLLAARLAELGLTYGDLPAHDGLWQAADATAHDLAARLAVVPLVLEARGLDVTPPMIERLRRAGDDRSADLLALILADEVAHVAAGRRWFTWIAEQRGEAPVPYWRQLVAQHYKSELKGPFNHQARAKAGFDRAFYAA